MPPQTLSGFHLPSTARLRDLRVVRAPVVRDRGQVRLRAVLRHVAVVGDRVDVLRLGGLHGGGRVGVVRHDVGALRDERLGGGALLARVEPRVHPHDLDLGLRVHAAHAARERVDAHHDLGDRERGDVARRVGLGHAARDDAREVAALVEARVVGADVLRALVAGRVLELHLREGRRDLDRRVHVAERGREDEVVAALRELADHALGVRALGHALDVLGRDLRAERLLHLLAADVVLVGPAGVADRAHVDVADLERLAGRACAAAGNATAVASAPAASASAVLRVIVGIEVSPGTGRSGRGGPGGPKGRILPPFRPPGGTACRARPAR